MSKQYLVGRCKYEKFGSVAGKGSVDNASVQTHAA